MSWRHVCIVYALHHVSPPVFPSHVFLRPPEFGVVGVAFASLYVSGLPGLDIRHYGAAVFRGHKIAPLPDGSALVSLGFVSPPDLGFGLPPLLGVGLHLCGFPPLLSRGRDSVGA